MHLEPDTGVICCRHILNEGAPIQRMAADHDGEVQFVCWAGRHETVDECAWVCFHCVEERDSGLSTALADLEIGQTAYRRAPDQPWVIEALPPEEHAA